MELPKRQEGRVGLPDSLVCPHGRTRCRDGRGARLQASRRADFDRVSKPDPEGTAKLPRELPANQWMLLPPPPKNVNPHPWGTCPYDTVRHQAISFGGGHSAAHYNDVAHYSLRTATWPTTSRTSDGSASGSRAARDGPRHRPPQRPSANGVWSKTMKL